MIKSIRMVTSLADMFRHRWSLAYLFMLPTIVMGHHTSDMGLREYNHSLHLQKPQIERVEANRLARYRSNNIVYRTHNLRIFSLMLTRKRYIGAWIETTTFIYSVWQYIGDNIVDRFGQILKQLGEIAIWNWPWTMRKQLWRKRIEFLHHLLTKCSRWRDSHCEIRRNRCNSSTCR